MTLAVTRREFVKSMAAGAVAAALPAPPAAAKKLKIGHTCITWGTFPRAPEAIATLEAAVKDIAELGYWSFETFAAVLEEWDAKGTLRALMDRYDLPLTAGYIGVNLTDPAARKDELAKVVRLAKVIQKCGGTFTVVSPNGVKRAEFDFKEHRAAMVAALDDYAMAVHDVGLGVGLHPHTGSCIETGDEIYGVMEAVKHMKFAPDVGQIQKGGSDAAKMMKDLLPLVRHVHLKDYSGGEAFGGYCPLGQGKVEMKTILDMLEGQAPTSTAMIELDPSKGAPLSARETAEITKAYLQKLDYGFRSRPA